VYLYQDPNLVCNFIIWVNGLAQYAELPSLHSNLNKLHVCWLMTVTYFSAVL